MVSHSKKFIFVHVPRAAGTSIENVLRPYASQSKTIKDTWPDRHKTWRNKYLFDAIRAYPHYFSFAVVRNPWDRLISAWKYFQCKETLPELIGKLRKFFDTNPEKYYSQIANNYCTRGISVSLESLHHDFQHKNFGYHILPQVYFLQAGVDYVGRYESLAGDWRAISARVGLDVTLPHMNSSSRGEYVAYYDERTADEVGELYAADIAAFDFSFDN